MTAVNAREIITSMVPDLALWWQPAEVKVEPGVEATRAMGTLSPGEREILILWNAGLCYGEIAERTGQLIEVVGDLLARARNRLVMAHDRTLGA